MTVMLPRYVVTSSGLSRLAGGGAVRVVFSIAPLGIGFSFGGSILLRSVDFSFFASVASVPLLAFYFVFFLHLMLSFFTIWKYMNAIEKLKVRRCFTCLRGRCKPCNLGFFRAGFAV